MVNPAQGRAAPTLAARSQEREGERAPLAAAGAALLVAGAAATGSATQLAARKRRRSSGNARLACMAKKEGSVQQLLGMKGATDEEVPLWKIRLQLCKPVTWPPLIMGCVAGAAASGNWSWEPEKLALLLVIVFLTGPCLTGYTQTTNDWYDREIDAINEPYRPIPSGRITETEVWEQIYTLLAIGLGLALGVDYYVGHLPGTPEVFLVACFGVLLAYIYSAPPVKLKRNGWIGNYALGFSYVSLPWWCGQAVFGTLTPDILLLTSFYSVAGLGIAIVNDFKSIEGDRRLGLDSIPVMYGVDVAKWLTVGLIDGVQLGVAAWVAGLGETGYALLFLALMLPQLLMQKTLLLEDPVKNDVEFQMKSLPFFQCGIIVAACAIGHSPLH